MSSQSTITFLSRFNGGRSTNEKKAIIKMDSNGNKIVKFKDFSIQTNQNLPKTHRLPLGTKLEINSEIEDYIMKLKEVEA